MCCLLKRGGDYLIHACVSISFERRPSLIYTMILKLEGHFSYIDRYNKLKFVFEDEASKDKLAKLCDHHAQEDDNLRRPYTHEGFTVMMPKTLKITDDIRDLVGLGCVLHVRPTVYCFTSKLDHNSGEQVRGVQLVLTDIRRADRYFSN